MKKSNQFLLLVPFFLLIILFLVIPIIIMIVASFKNDANTLFTLKNYVELLSKHFYYQALKNSIIISVSSAIVGLIGAFIISLSMLQLSEKTQHNINYFLNIAANFAGVPLAFSFILLLGNSGVLRLMFKQSVTFDLYSWIGLALTYSYFQISLGVIFIYPILRKIRKEWVEAATLLGASPFTYWQKIIIPVLSPSLVGSFILLFANGMGTYETAYALTGSNFNLLTVRISALSTGDVFARPNTASALATLFMIMMILVMLVSQHFMKKTRNYQ